MIYNRSKIGKKKEYLGNQQGITLKIICVYRKKKNISYDLNCFACVDIVSFLEYFR